jgi:hypothetical protein
MSEATITAGELQSQADQWPYGPLTVEVREPGNKVSSSVKGFANLTVPLGADGAITISGFSILCAEGQPLRVLPPGRKGTSRYFDTVSLVGNIRHLAERAILYAWEHRNRSAV